MTKKTLETEDILEKVQKQVETFLTQTQIARIASERDRDYVDHKQWTPEEIAKLTGRQQAPIVVNRVKPKVAGLLGLLSMRQTDPKAYPRTQKHEKSAEAITDALRYVADNNDFNDCKMEVSECFFVEGYGGAIVDVQKDGNGEAEIRIEEIPWDRIYFDPHSRKKDFNDARYMGLILWMDIEEAKEKFPKTDLDALIASNGSVDRTFEDRPRWVDGVNKRVRVAQHFYKKNNKWWMCIFTEDLFLLEPDESPYLDEFGQPGNPIELVSAYIDRDNARYGEVRAFIDQQDEINHRRSKALHLLSQRQTASRQGAVKDVAAMKRELAKPNGHVEYQGEKGDFEILETGDMAKGQFELYQDAKAELDAVSVNAQLSGERQQGDLSGIAIQKLQQAGTMELNGLFSTLNGWEKRIYRQVWARIRQFWTAEKWVRVTDDADNLRWVGLNAEVTAQEWLEEQVNDKSAPLHQKKKAAAAYQFLMSAVESQDQQAAAVAKQKLEQIVNIKNPVAELDVDIILDMSFDSVNIQQEQFELLAKFANGTDIDITELIELSQLRGKDELIEKIQKRRQEQAQQASQIPPADGAKLQLSQQQHQDNMQLELMKHKDNMQLEREKMDAKKHEKAVSIQVGQGGVQDVSQNTQGDNEVLTNIGQALIEAITTQTQATERQTQAILTPRIVSRNAQGKVSGLVPVEAQ